MYVYKTYIPKPLLRLTRPTSRLWLPKYAKSAHSMSATAELLVLH